MVTPSYISTEPAPSSSLNGACLGRDDAVVLVGGAVPSHDELPAQIDTAPKHETTKTCRNKKSSTALSERSRLVNGLFDHKMIEPMLVSQAIRSGLDHTSASL